MLTKKIHLQVLIVLAVLFLLLQIFFSVYSPQTYLSVFGVIHLISLTFFVLSFLFCHKISKEAIFFYILVYQLVLVISHYYFYVYYYGDPFGANPTDENWYHAVGLQLQGESLLASVKYIISIQGLGDLGFPLLMKYVYAFGGNEILNMKLVNISFHLITCFLLYRITKLLIKDSHVAKILLVLYGLNPITVFFNASGRKEPFFILIVVASFYFLYKAYLKKNIRYLIPGFLFLMATGLFRIPYPVMIALSFLAYFYLDSKGRYKVVFRIAILILTPLVFLTIWLFIREELIAILLRNRSLAVTERIGRTAGLFEYAVLLISGIIGPIPTFTYGMENENYLFQTVANFVKIVFSFFFLVGFYQALKKRLKSFYPMLFFVTGNIAVFTFAAATFDHRFHYPFIPFYFIIIAYGYHLLKNQNFILTKFIPYVIFLLALILGYNFR